MTSRSAFLALALTAAAAPSAAQDDAGAAADISGRWAFETAVYDVSCRMTGELSLTPTADPNVFEGQLMAYEQCEGRQIYQAEQVSVARRTGDALEITSTLKRVLPYPDFYAPDNFRLTIVNGALMTGELRSADIAPATFRRREALVS